MGKFICSHCRKRLENLKLPEDQRKADPDGACTSLRCSYTNFGLDGLGDRRMTIGEQQCNVSLLYPGKVFINGRRTF